MRGLLAVEILYYQIIKGLKGQTRRASGLDEVNGRKATKKKAAIVTNPDDWFILGIGFGLVGEEGAFNNLVSMFKGGEIITPSPLKEVNFINKITGKQLFLKPRYSVGEVLYLKEPYTFLKSDTTCFWNGYAYKFGATKGCAISDRGAELGGTEIVFKNKLFMPAEAGRQFIKITGIRCERLLDISDEDCQAEGIETGSFRGRGEHTKISWKNYQGEGSFVTPKESFLSLYKFANKTKDVPNLWVWCYTFEHLKDYRP